MRRLGMMAGALVAGMMMVSSAGAQVTGYLAGDPSPGKLIPYFRANGETATLIGIENTFGEDGPNAFGAFDVAVHVSVFTVTSAEVTDFTLCLSPFDFGFVILQRAPLQPGQAAELFDGLTPAGPRINKARVLSVEDGDLTIGGSPVTEGYVTLGTIGVFTSNDVSCNQLNLIGLPSADSPLASWAILADVSRNFATEIPTPTAIVDVNPSSVDFGQAFGGPGAYGLIPAGNRVISRFDVNPGVDSVTEIFVWLERNGSGSLTAFLDCEDEFEQSTTIPLNREVNIINPDLLAGINQCKIQGQFRGVLRFVMPETGFLWSHITQAGDSFRQNYLGYNLDFNEFICPPGTVCP